MENSTGGTGGCWRKQQQRMQAPIKLIKVINPETPKTIHNPLIYLFN